MLERKQSRSACFHSFFEVCCDLIVTLLLPDIKGRILIFCFVSILAIFDLRRQEEQAGIPESTFSFSLCLEDFGCSTCFLLCMIIYPDEKYSFCPLVPPLNVIHLMGMSWCLEDTFVWASSILVLVLTTV